MTTLTYVSGLCDVLDKALHHNECYVNIIVKFRRVVKTTEHIYFLYYDLILCAVGRTLLHLVALLLNLPFTIASFLQITWFLVELGLLSVFQYLLFCVHVLAVFLVVLFPSTMVKNATK